MSGTGNAWVDDLELLVDGKPLWEAPKASTGEAAIDRDREFDATSGVQLSALSKAQVENLVLLGKVWGFLKYHHPAIVSGKRHWDFDLFRVLPKLLSAQDGMAANAAIEDWIAKLGDLPECSKTCFPGASKAIAGNNATGGVAACIPCAAKLADSNLQLRPDIGWIEDEARLGKILSSRLTGIYAGRSGTIAKQFYVSRVSNVGNPVFENERAYAQLKLPDAGYQLLALYRFWNIIEYWAPYRDVIGENWDAVLAEFIPKIALARSRDEYQLQLMALIARIHDTHANLWSSLSAQPPVGECQLPATVRFVENKALATGVDASTADSSGLRTGDVIAELDGAPVGKLIENWRPYYAASNEPTRLRDIARSMTRGACGDVSVRIERNGETLAVKAQRVKPQSGSARSGMTHDLPGQAFQLLPENVAYLNLSAVKSADAAEYVKKAAGTKGWILDIRNYPSEFVVFALGQHLVEKETPFARFTSGDLSNPGAFHWQEPALSLTPAKPFYSGKVVVLVDETTQSSAEYTSMAFRTAPRAVVIGSTTAGADGNVSQFALPGGLQSMISGIGVFYPDKKPTQRIGILPDITVTPTIAGIRAGKDEVLEAAFKWILQN